MSKEKPEAGDVWGKARYDVYARILRDDLEFDGVPYVRIMYMERDEDKLNFFIETFTLEGFKRLRFKYLGKSKVSIKELFDVKD